jgi:hypothetical protein
VPVWTYATPPYFGYSVSSSPAGAGGVVFVASCWEVYAFGVHDVAVTNVASTKTVVCQGFSANINVTVANQGGYTETFNVTAYANATAIQTETLTLTSQNSTTLTFTWNTIGFAQGNYTLSAYAWPVPSETNTADNNFTDGWVIVSMVGDVTGNTFLVPDVNCNGADIAVVAMCFGSCPRCPPPLTGYPNCDVNNDGHCDGADIAIVAIQFGKADP